MASPMLDTISSLSQGEQANWKKSINILNEATSGLPPA
jgi:hypothetical protein